VLIEGLSSANRRRLHHHQVGPERDGWRVGKPSENIVVPARARRAGHGARRHRQRDVGRAWNVWCTTASQGHRPRACASSRWRGRGGVVENVWYERVRHEDLRLRSSSSRPSTPRRRWKPRTQTPPTIPGHTRARPVSAIGPREPSTSSACRRADRKTSPSTTFDVASKGRRSLRRPPRNVRSTGQELPRRDRPLSTIEADRAGGAGAARAPRWATDCLRLGGSNEKADHR